MGNKDNKMVFDGMTLEQVLCDYLGIDDSDPDNLLRYCCNGEFMQELMVVMEFATLSNMHFYLSGDEPYIPKEASNIVYTKHFTLCESDKDYPEDFYAKSRNAGLTLR